MFDMSFQSVTQKTRAIIYIVRNKAIKRITKGALESAAHGQGFRQGAPLLLFAVDGKL